MKRAAIRAGVASAVLAGALLAPLALRHVPFFRVRSVELIGARYLAPEQVVARLGLRADQNLFDDAGMIERRAADVAGVERATVERRLPGTLRVIVTEQAPVALAPGPGGLIPVDSLGRALPYDPAATGLDLPLVRRLDAVVLAALARVRAADSALYQVVEGAEGGPGGMVILEFGQRRVLLRGVPTAEQVHAVAAVRRHLAATGRGYTDLDARFRGWVVARRARM